MRNLLCIISFSLSDLYLTVQNKVLFWNTSSVHWKSDVFSGVVEWNVLHMSIRSVFSQVCQRNPLQMVRALLVHCSSSLIFPLQIPASLSSLSYPVPSVGQERRALCSFPLSASAQNLSLAIKMGLMHRSLIGFFSLREYHHVLQPLIYCLKTTDSYVFFLISSSYFIMAEMKVPGVFKLYSSGILSQTKYYLKIIIY